MNQLDLHDITLQQFRRFRSGIQRLQYAVAAAAIILLLGGISTLCLCFSTLNCRRPAAVTGQASASPNDTDTLAYRMPGVQKDTLFKITLPDGTIVQLKLERLHPK
jgi:hypothetical protein